MGEDIEKRQYENRYGSHFYENVSKDLRKALNLTRGMSESTIRYTHYFYCLYSQLIENYQQDAEVFQVIFNIPWTYHMCIIDKVKGDAKKGLFFTRKSLDNNWDHITRFLVELGKGFSYVGKEYRLVAVRGCPPAATGRFEKRPPDPGRDREGLDGQIANEAYSFFKASAGLVRAARSVCQITDMRAIRTERMTDTTNIHQ